MEKELKPSLVVPVNEEHETELAIGALMQLGLILMNKLSRRFMKGKMNATRST